MREKLEKKEKELANSKKDTSDVTLLLSKKDKEI
jgi:hypothetical protein